MRRLLTLGALVVALVLSSCGGDDKKKSTTETTTSPAAAEAVEAPTESATRDAALGQLPQEFLDCMADEGFEVASIADIHSAPPEVLQACFGALHGGAGGP